MSEVNEEVADNAPTSGVGQKLRAARNAKGLTLEQLAAETRISLRHLEHIEAGEFEDLPGRTYALGFTKTFAKTVGLDPSRIAEQVREEMELEPARPQAGEGFEPGEATNAPSGRLVWFSIFAVILLLAGLFFAGQHVFGDDVEWDSLVEEAPVVDASGDSGSAGAAGEDDAVVPDGPVVFTAEDVVWVRFTDAAGLVLMESEMSAGESYTVPADAEGPVVITGRPDLLAITIGGQSVAKLSTEPLTVVDEPVSAAALLSREQSGPSGQLGTGETQNNQSQANQSQSTQNRAVSSNAPASSAASPRPRRDARPTPRASPSARPADAESASNTAPAPPRFVSDPVIQAVEPRGGARPAQ